MNRPGRIGDARIDNPAYGVNNDARAGMGVSSEVR